MKNEKLFKQNMGALGEIHGKEISNLLMALYWKVLEPFPDAECDRAFKDMIFNSKFFPKPADFLESLRGKKEDQAALAWVRVEKAIRRIGPYQSIRFADDPAIMSAIQCMGGWPEFGNISEKELPWKAREFQKLYVIMKGGENHPSYLPGITERDNSAHGFGDLKTEIIEIGNQGERKRLESGAPASH